MKLLFSFLDNLQIKRNWKVIQNIYGKSLNYFTDLMIYVTSTLKDAVSAILFVVDCSCFDTVRKLQVSPTVTMLKLILARSSSQFIYITLKNKLLCLVGL